MHTKTTPIQGEIRHHMRWMLLLEENDIGTFSIISVASLISKSQ